MSHVLVSYFDPFDLFDNLKSELLRIVPLKNVHWKPSSGSVRTVAELPVRFETEDRNQNDSSGRYLAAPFMRLIIVTCLSIEDYRSKVRPLLRQWLPEQQNNDSSRIVLECMPLVVFYSNSEVVDSSIFKATSLMEKFNKDFPGTHTLELRSVYKSPKEKDDFWNHVSQQIKTYIVAIFHQRLAHLTKLLNNKLSTSQDLTNLEQLLPIRENIMQLYMNFGISEEGIKELLHIKALIETLGLELPKGQIDPKMDIIWKPNESIFEQKKSKKLTLFNLYSIIFKANLALLKLDCKSPQYLNQFYDVVMNYSRTIKQDFQRDLNLLEFECSLFDHAIQELSEFKELKMYHTVMGDLLLIRRDYWLQGAIHSKKYKFLHKSLTAPVEGYRFDKFANTCNSEEKFQKSFFRYTQDILYHFSQSEGKRQHAVDIISVEIGMLHYQRKEYEKAVLLFVSCYEYYTEAHWNTIGCSILKVFVDSLLNCKNVEQLNIDDSIISISDLLSGALLNLLKMSTDLNEKNLWWDKFLSIQDFNKGSPVFKLDGLFDVLYANHTTLIAPNTHAVRIQIMNAFYSDNVKLDSITLTVKDDEDRTITFESTDVMMEQDITQVDLKTEKIAYGVYSPVSFQMSLNGVQFVRTFAPGDEKIDIKPLTSKHCVMVEAKHSNTINLGSYTLDLTCHNLEVVEKIEVDLSVIGDSDLVSFDSKKTDQSVLKLDNIAKIHQIEYYLQVPIPSFSLNLVCRFKKKNDPKSYEIKKIVMIKSYLNISVSVEDIFKKDVFFYKFLLSSSSMEEPVLLFGSKLIAPTYSDRYTILGEYNPSVPERLRIEAEESCLNCYRITTSEAFDSSDEFQLCVKYSTMKDLLDSLLTDAILVKGDIEWYNEFDYYRIFWDTSILPTLRYDYEKFEDEKTIKLVNDSNELRDLALQCHWINMGPGVRARIEHCFRKGIKGVPINAIDLEEYARNVMPKQLNVPVKLPDVDQLFHVEILKLSQQSVKVGQPVRFEISITNNSYRWGQKDLSNGEFVFEISNSNDWLSHFRKRFALRSKAIKYENYLIPLRKGYLKLPDIEITSIEGVPCKVDYSNEFDGILVL